MLSGLEISGRSCRVNRYNANKSDDGPVSPTTRGLSRQTKLHLLQCAVSGSKSVAEVAEVVLDNVVQHEDIGTYLQYEVVGKDKEEGCDRGSDLLASPQELILSNVIEGIKTQQLATVGSFVLSCDLVQSLEYVDITFNLYFYF